MFVQGGTEGEVLRRGKVVLRVCVVPVPTHAHKMPLEVLWRVLQAHRMLMACS
jgi:hypothetical protein